MTKDVKQRFGARDLIRYNIFAVLPFFFFILAAAATKNIVFSLLVIFVAPIALVVMYLDVYFLIRKSKS